MGGIYHLLRALGVIAGVLLLAGLVDLNLVGMHVDNTGSVAAWLRNRLTMLVRRHGP